MFEFYELFQVYTDEDMARHLNMDVEDLKRHVKSGRVPWVQLIPALVERGVTVEIIMGTMQLGMVRDKEKVKEGASLRVRAKVDYNQMLELRRMKIL